MALGARDIVHVVRKTPEVNFVITGGRQVGKTTFVRCALDLKDLPVADLTTKKMSLEGTLFLVNLYEIPLEEVVFEPSRTAISWPSTVKTSKVDGVLVLYDVTNQQSITRVPGLLSELSVFLSRILLS